MITLLDRYLARTVLFYTLLVMAVLLTLGALFTFIGQQDDIGTGTYGVVDAFLFTALAAPQQAFELLPIGALIGALVGLGNLARGSELVVVRASGVSVVRLAWSAALAGIVITGAMWVLGEHIAPPLDQYARQHKIFSKFADYDFGGSRSAWIKDGTRLINVKQQTAENMFGGVYLFEVAPDRTLARVGRAERATLAADSTWQLASHAETRFENGGTRSERFDATTLATTINPEFLGLAVVDRGSLPVRGLAGYVAHLKANGLESRAYEIAYWSRIARTASAILVCILAVPFSFGPLRSAGAGARTVVGILVGVLFFLVNRTLENSGQVYDLSPLVVAWLPTAALALVAAVAIWRTR